MLGKRFSISRINTSSGIFRLQGELSTQGSAHDVHYLSVEFMGTDGWQPLDLSLPQAKTILNSIEQEVLTHLIEQSNLN